MYTERSTVFHNMKRTLQSTTLWKRVALPFGLTVKIAEFYMHTGLCSKTNKETD
jgi:hypothetical protein